MGVVFNADVKPDWDGKWKDGYTFLNKNSLIVDAHLSLSKYRERKFTLLEVLYNCF